MPPTESMVKMNGFAALDPAVGICSPAIMRSVAAPSPEFRCAASFYQRQICEKYLTVPTVPKQELHFVFFNLLSLLFSYYVRKNALKRIHCENSFKCGANNYLPKVFEPCLVFSFNFINNIFRYSNIYSS